MNTLLHEILRAREERARRQEALLQQYRCPVVSFTMNIAGPVKTSGRIRRAFATGLEELEAALKGEIIRSREVRHEITGDEALFCVDMPAAELKAICTAIEERSPIGRLFDMDVLDVRGRKLERSGERCCLICGLPGRSCAARRVHSVQQLQEATSRLIAAHFDEPDGEEIASAAVNALILEVQTTPKPGLVDMRNNGSHQDMDLPMFLTSAKALRPYFRQCATLGQTYANEKPEAVFPLLRQAGLQAEAQMYAATGGVNTHKGAIYTFGILCAALGRLLHRGENVAQSLLPLCSEIAGKAAREDLAHGLWETAGLQLYRQAGIPGIRGEMAMGLPSVGEVGLPAFRRALAQGRSKNDAGVIALLHLMACVQDTNLYHRGGEEGAAFAAAAAREILSGAPEEILPRTAALDDAFIARNLSPGGCADLLAVIYFLDQFL